MRARTAAPLLVLAVALFCAATASAGIQTLDLPVKDAVYNPHDGLLYVSVPSSGGLLANSVAAVDPVAGDVVDWVFVGSEPGEMALSDDGSVLWVGLDGSGGMRRVEVPGLTAGLEFSFGVGTFGPRFAFDVEVQPGETEVVVASLYRSGVSPPLDGTVVYDSGVARPDMGPGHTGADRIEFSHDPGILYGQNVRTTEFGFRTLEVDLDGTRVVDVVRDLIPGFGIDIVFQDGRIFASNGYVVDPVLGLVVGTFAGLERPAAVAPDPAHDLVHFLDEVGFHAYEIVSYRASTFQPLPAAYPPLPAGFDGTGMVRWDDAGLAVFGVEGLVLLSPDGSDADGDGVPDELDNCPHTPNPGQADADGDFQGDVCDPFPDEANDLLACLDARDADALLIADLAAENEALRALLADGDGDGVLDSADLCPATPDGAGVDLGGCSAAEFCARWEDRLSCRFADWRGDEPGTRLVGDCRWLGGGCVAVP